MGFINNQKSISPSKKYSFNVMKVNKAPKKYEGNNTTSGGKIKIKLDEYLS